MKKTLFLISLCLVLLIAGCNEKSLLSDINGTWRIQEYTVSGKNLTARYDSSHVNFRWNFSGGKSFYQTWSLVHLYNVYNNDTIAHLDTTTHMLVIDSVITSVAVVPSSYTTMISGDWYLTNGNQWLETRDSMTGNQLYQIVDYSGSNLHLVNGNQDFYLIH